MAGGGRTTSTSAPDPEVSALNRLMRGEIEQTLPLAGGLPGITAARPGALPGAGERDILARIGQVAGAPVDVPGFRREQAGQFSPFFSPRAFDVPQVGVPELARGAQPGGAGAGFAPFAGIPGVGAAQVPIPGVRTAQQIFQPAMADLQQAFQKTVAPGVINYLTAAGLGRSGAVGENLAQAGAQFVAPTIQQAMGFAEQDLSRQQAAQLAQAGFQQQAGLTGAGFLQEALRGLEARQQQAGLAGAGFAQEAAQAGAGREQAANLAQFGAQAQAGQQQASMAQQAALALQAAQGRAGEQAAAMAQAQPIPGQTELERLPTALSALEGPRLAQLAEESRRGDILLQLLQGFPQGQVSTSSGRQGANILGPLGSAAGSGMLAAAMKGAGGCWIAAALYGEGTEKFHLARLWIMERWQGRVADLVRRLYLRYGQRIARHPQLVRPLRPLFNLAVRKARGKCPPHEWDPATKCLKCGWEPLRQDPQPPLWGVG